MAKITATDIEQAGFRREQFGTPADFALYLAPVIDDAGVWAEDAVGAAAYAAAAGVQLMHIRRAELCFAKDILWTRRVAFLDSNANAGLDASAYLNRREMLEHAAKARACADEEIEIAKGLGNVPGSAISVGHIETGPYPPLSSARLNT